MHSPSFRQLLVASTIIFFCLFLYAGRLWSTHTSQAHDEWAQPALSPQTPPPPPPPASDSPSASDGKPVHQTALQQTPYHWNEYPLLDAFYHGIYTLVDYVHWTPEQSKSSGEVKVLDKIPVDPVPVNPYSRLEEVNTCYLDDDDTVPAPDVFAYKGLPAYMPAPYFGGYEELGMVKDQCWERFGRFGPYGYSYSKAKGGFGLEKPPAGEPALDRMIQKFDYTGVNWNKLQKRCFDKNAARFDPTSAAAKVKPDGALSRLWPQAEKVAGAKKSLPRNVFILRAWTSIEWTPMRIINTRALINELSLKSGGQFDVHILMHVQDDSIDISDEATAQKVVRDNVPEEFWDITTPWSVPDMAEYYPGFQDDMTMENDSHKPLYSVYRIPHFALQWFAQRHPEYEYFWNWELDLRYFGHYYELFNSAAQWADKQPRKYLWERNERFWIPGLHGTYADFMSHVADETVASHESSPWGPMINDGIVDTATYPPTTMERDNYEWGVGEAADLITFSPLFDPAKNAWSLRYDITGYNDTVPPRRTSIITVGRFSRRLLQAMHEEVSRNHHTMFPEMFPGSIALHHGLKAVYLPHPIFFDRRWPLERLDSVFNHAETPELSVYYWPHTPGTSEHNFFTSTYYYNTEFGPQLYHRWLGQEDGDTGGPELEKEMGRMCLRPALMHPVKADFPGQDKAIGAT
ncbi:unnamed protein product [Discula destructiva]